MSSCRSCSLTFQGSTHPRCATTGSADRGFEYGRKCTATTQRHIRNFVAAVLFAISWLGVASTAAANEIYVYLPTIVTWSSPFPFVPSTVSGSMLVGDAPNNVRDLRSIPFDGVDPAGGSMWLSGMAYVIEPGTTLYWALGGRITFGDLTLPMCAYDGFAVPATECNPDYPPIVPLHTFTTQYFGSLDFGGALFATFDGAAVQVGTWQIHTNQDLVGPEPATLLLVGGALVLLALRQRAATGSRVLQSPGPCGKRRP